MKKPFQAFNLKVENKGNDTVDIHIDGQIVDASTQEIIKAWFGDSTSVSFKSFRDEVGKTDAKTYNVYINSPGGLVTDAMAIHDLLVGLTKKGKTVNTIGIGMVASSATLILLASPNPQMTANSFFMIHTVSGGCYGTVDQIESYGKSMRKFNNLIVDMYAAKTGISKEDLNNMMVEETFLTAQEAEDQKFIWKKVDSQEYTNRIDPDYWDFKNKDVLNLYNSAASKEDTATTFDNMKKFFADMSKSILDAINGIKPIENTLEKPLDQTAFLANIANAMQTSFTAMADTFETAVKDEVTNQVTAQTATLTQEITDLNSELVLIKGKQTTAEKEEQPKNIGSFSSSKAE